MPKPNDDALALGLGRRKPAEQIREELNHSPFAGPAAEAAGSTMVAVRDIGSSPYQSRGEVDESHIEALMTSIAESGLLAPILIRKVSNFDTPFELVAGHNRLEAFRRLGREHIPASVRPLSDQEAARALTVENTHHKNLTDWELFKHLKMLRAANAVKNATDLAGVLGVARTHIYNLEAFAALPPEVVPLLDKRPDLIGGKLAYDLREYAEKHPAAVAEGIQMLSAGELKQAGVLGWVQRKVSKPVAPYRKEVAIRGGGKTVKLVITDGEAKVSGDLNFDRLHALIEAHLSELTEPSNQQ